MSFWIIHPLFRCIVVPATKKNFVSKYFRVLFGLMQKIQYLLLCVICFWGLGCKKPVSQPAENSAIYLLEDKTAKLSNTEALQAFEQGKFVLPATNEMNPGFTQSIFWLALKNEQLATADSLLFYIGDHHINRIHFYYVADTGLQLQYTTGDYFPNAQKPVPATGFYFPIQKKGTYLARVDKANESLQLFFWLISYKKAMTEENRNALVMALLTGMMVLMMSFGVFLYFMTKENLYLFYTVYLLSGWLWVLANGGYGFEYLWGNAPWFASKARPAFALLTGAANLLFMMKFIGVRTPWMKKLSNRIVITILVFVGISLAVNEKGYQSIWWMIMLYAIPVGVLCYLILSLYFLIRSAINGNKYAKFYLAGALVLLVSAVMQSFIQLINVYRFQYFLTHFGIGVGYVVEAFILIAGLAYRFNEYRREKEALLQQVNRNQLENIRIVTEVQHQERNQIANQLHDVAGSMLSAARLNLSVMRHSKETGEMVTEDALEKTETAIVHVSDMVRNLSHALSPVMLEKVGFKTSIEKLSDLINSSGKITLQTIFIGFDTYKPQLNRYYTEIHGMVYELLNNIIKHSKASHALLQLSEAEDAITIMIEDDGIGMKTPKTTTNNSLGLSALKSKTALMYGEFSIDQNQPQGTIITIYLPLQNI